MQILGAHDGLGNQRVTLNGSPTVRQMTMQVPQDETIEIRKEIDLILQAKLRQASTASNYTPWLQMQSSLVRPPRSKVLRAERRATWTREEREVLTKMIGLFASGDEHFSAKHDEIYDPPR